MLIRNLSKAATAASVMVLAGCEGGILDPKGQVGIDEKHLIIVSTLLMLIVVLPVIFMTLYFAWKYREGREQEIYAPKWAHSTRIETVVWIVPVIIVIVLGVITWQSTQSLDPYKPLDNERDHITVEVVSMDWKWLFIYPDYGVASVNELVFPANVPVKFKITSDTAMNSFFIPQLGSQIYSMAGMETKVHLIANQPGTFDGFSANYSGAGFAGMQFKAIATANDADFASWVAKLKQQKQQLNPQSYQQLAKASENNPVEYYGSVSEGMFHHIVMQYMQPHMAMDHQHHAGHMANMEDASTASEHVPHKPELDSVLSSTLTAASQPSEAE